jgi:hypothetical protein
LLAGGAGEKEGRDGAVLHELQTFKYVNQGRGRAPAADPGGVTRIRDRYGVFVARPQVRLLADPNGSGVEKTDRVRDSRRRRRHVSIPRHTVRPTECPSDLPKFHGASAYWPVGQVRPCIPKRHHHLLQVTRRIRRASLSSVRASPGVRSTLRDCQMPVQQLLYLGHVIGSECNQPQERHLQQIQDAPTPQTKKQLQSFLGLANWVREYVPRFAETAAPLTDLLHKRKPFKWTSAIQEAIHQLKTAMNKALVLHRPNPEFDFILQSDASGVGIAAVLFQEHQGTRRIISYASARLNEAQRRYHINEQECFAIVWAVKKYRPYLEEGHFSLRTDNKALLWLNTAKESSAKLTRWALLFQEFSFTVEHCPWKQKELPDLLSRQPDDDAAHVEAEDDERMLAPRTCRLSTEVINTIDVVKAAQLADPNFPETLQRLERVRREWARERGERFFAEVYFVEGEYNSRGTAKRSFCGCRRLPDHGSSTSSTTLQRRDTPDKKRLTDR